MKHARKVGGTGNRCRHTHLCWACPGHTFNAGQVCTDCLKAGLDPVPEDLRQERRPTSLGNFIAVARRRLTWDEFARLLDGLRRVAA